MNIYAWVALAIIALEALLLIGRVGKPRKPMSNRDAVFAVVEWGIIAWLIVMAALG